MIIGINKPEGMTSHDVVGRVRKITNEKRVGHGGTLDPLASGVLVIGITRESTKKLSEILKNTDKEYIAVLELGKTSTTDDREGEITISKNISELKNIKIERIEKTLEKFKGEIEQTPPIYSAIKIKGTPAYKLARRGEEVSIEKREIFIKNLEIIEYSPPLLTIKVLVSSGTYIRSLARDIGDSLGVGAYLKELTRTRVGKFTLEDCKTLEQFEKDKTYTPSVK